MKNKTMADFSVYRVSEIIKCQSKGCLNEAKKKILFGNREIYLCLDCVKLLFNFEDLKKLHKKDFQKVLI